MSNPSPSLSDIATMLDSKVGAAISRMREDMARMREDMTKRETRMLLWICGIFFAAVGMLGVYITALALMLGGDR